MLDLEFSKMRKSSKMKWNIQDGNMNSNIINKTMNILRMMRMIGIRKL
jgi:hypothetical protein